MIRRLSDPTDPRVHPYWEYHDPWQLIPVDVAAERTVAGCMIATDHGARLGLAHGIIEGHDDFAGYWCCSPFHDRTIALAAHVATELHPGLHTDERVARIAEQLGLYHHHVLDLVVRRSVMFDTTGWHAHRVLEAARRRAQIRRWLDQGEQLGVLVEPLIAQAGPTMEPLLAAQPAKLEAAAA